MFLKSFLALAALLALVQFSVALNAENPGISLKRSTPPLTKRILGRPITTGVKHTKLSKPAVRRNLVAEASEIKKRDEGKCEEEDYGYCEGESTRHRLPLPPDIYTMINTNHTFPNQKAASAAQWTPAVVMTETAPRRANPAAGTEASAERANNAATTDVSRRRTPAVANTPAAKTNGAVPMVAPLKTANVALEVATAILERFVSRCQMTTKTRRWFAARMKTVRNMMGISMSSPLPRARVTVTVAQGGFWVWLVLWLCL